jgi:hypothetical protein
MDLKTFSGKLLFMAVFFPLLLSTGCQNKKSAENGWVQLFDGESLEGWKVLGGKADFYTEDGMIVCNTRLDIGGGYLVTERSYDDFILELDVKIDTSLNSGVQCRGRIWEKDTVTVYRAGNPQGTLRETRWDSGYVWGYQIEVDPKSRAWSGGLYEPGNRGWVVTLEGNDEARRAFKPMDWNHFKILMDGNRIRTWVNGVKAVDTTDDMSSSGFIGLQFHSAHREWQQDKKVLWKNIKIREL